MSQAWFCLASIRSTLNAYFLGSTAVTSVLTAEMLLLKCKD